MESEKQTISIKKMHFKKKLWFFPFRRFLF